MSQAVPVSHEGQRRLRETLKSESDTKNGKMLLYTQLVATR